MSVTQFPAAVPVTEADLSPEFSDDALALEFPERHKGELRFVAKWGSWLYWDGTRWKFEDTLRAFDLARAVAREFANACNDSDDKPKIASAKTVAAIERRARADRRHAAIVEQWDADSWVLNTPGGIVDLRSGSTSLHDPERYMTKIAAVAPGGSALCGKSFSRKSPAVMMSCRAFCSVSLDMHSPAASASTRCFSFTAPEAMARACSSTP
jgi:putative DNA primase/helicase